MKRAVLAIALTGSAYADTPLDRPEAIEVDRDAPPIGRVEFGFDGGAPVGAWSGGIQLGYLDRPIALRSLSRSIVPVRHRETIALGAALALSPSVAFDMRLPLAHQVGDRYNGIGDDRALDRDVLGDLGVAARVRVVASDQLAAFVRAQVTLPTGDDHEFAGEPSWTVAWMLIGRLMLPRHIVIAATGGARLRGKEVQVADQVVGDELAGGLGISVPLPPIGHLWCVPDQVRLAAEAVFVLGDHVAHQRSPSPAEVRFGLVTQPRPDLTFGVRLGAGLDDQIGSPRFRATIELAWHGAPPVASPASPADPED